MKKTLIAIMFATALLMSFCIVGCSTPELPEITGITFENVDTVYDGSEKEITINGTLPDGVTVR